MPYLKMYIGRMLVDSVEIEYNGMNVCRERQDHQENLAYEMYQTHIKKIKQSMREPEFFVIQESAMNRMSIQEINQSTF